MYFLIYYSFFGAIFCWIMLFHSWLIILTQSVYIQYSRMPLKTNIWTNELLNLQVYCALSKWRSWFPSSPGFQDLLKIIQTLIRDMHMLHQATAKTEMTEMRWLSIIQMWPFLASNNQGGDGQLDSINCSFHVTGWTNRWICSYFIHSLVTDKCLFSLLFSRMWWTVIVFKFALFLFALATDWL